MGTRKRPRCPRHDLAAGVDQRATGVTRLEDCCDPDQPDELLGVPADVITDRDRLIEGQDRTSDDARDTATTTGVADRRDTVPHRNAAGVS